MNFFLSSKIAVSLLAILVCVCDCSVKEDAVPLVSTNVPSKDAPSKTNYERRQSNSRTGSSTTLAPPESMTGESCHDDLACLSMASHDRLGLEAIRTLHRQLDDDANGVIELSESDEFLREELKYDDGAEKRQKAFHKNDDMHVSVKELWDVWIKSEVHNWTVEQTADWLSSSVELPQYVPIFIMNRVTGAQLPRLAVSNMHFLNNVLGIKDPIHKQKITLKAMDVVLFGPPKDSTSHVKDYILGTLIFVALTICWYVYRQKESSQEHLRRMMKDMEGLQRAELDLSNLQKELERARQEQENAASEKIKLERRLQEHQALQTDGADNKSSAGFSDLEVCQLKQEIELLRNELQRAEGELEDRCWTPPPGLQHWLQLTHEIENKAYVKKKVMAEKQLQQAREACEKLRKKRSSLVGAFVSTHGKSIDDVDRSIVEARTSLNEVTQELAERVHRWKQIELMLGFNIINNSGLAYLENMLYRNTPNGRSLLKSRMNSQDDLDDDTNSNYSLPMPPGVTDRGGCEGWPGWRGDSHDSSSSERMEDDTDDTHAPRSVHFTLGAACDETAAPSSGGDYVRRSETSGVDQNGKRFTLRPHSDHYRSVDHSRGASEFSRQSSQSSGAGEFSRSSSGKIAKSYSDEFAETIDQEIEKQLAKIQSSQSDNFLDNNHYSKQNGRSKARRPPPSKLGDLRQYSMPQNGPPFSQGCQSGQNTPEEDTSHSTDSGSIPGDPDVEDLRKNTRKHRIHFPKFSKKSIRLSSSNPKLQPT